MADISTLTFDTLKFARRLKQAGMDARLAEALQTNLKQLATKVDIADLRKDLQPPEQRMIVKLGGLMVVGAVAALVKPLYRA